MQNLIKLQNISGLNSNPSGTVPVFHGKVLGQDDVGVVSPVDPSANYVIYQQFTAIASGNAVTIKIRGHDSGNVKVAIYSDSGNLPSSRLVQTGSTAIISGVNSISISDTSIVNGTKYWLAYNQDGAAVKIDAAGTGRTGYEVNAFGNAFPATAGNISGTITIWDVAIAAYA